MMSKAGALRSEVKKLGFDFFAFDGPFDCVAQAKMPAASATGTDDASPTASPETLTLEPAARAWYDFSTTKETGRYRLFEESLAYVVAQLDAREQAGASPVRGLFAFSQGTVVATALLARRARIPTLRALSFVVMVSGLLPTDVELKAEVIAAAPFRGILSMHIIGTADRLVEPAESHALRRLFEGDGAGGVMHVLHEHGGGHVIPSQARRDFKTFAAHIAASIRR
jgi:predicted esterase